MALGPDDWITLEEAKRHLNKDVLNMDSDEELSDFIQRAEAAAVSRIGYVKQPSADLVEYRPGGGSSVRLNHRPVFEASVATVSVYGTTVPAADRDAGAAGWYLDNPRTGLLRHTDTFPVGVVRIAYKPGWDVIPADIAEGTLELLRHMWRTQRGPLGGRGRIGRGEEPIDATGVPGAGYQWPNRVEQLLHPYTQVPVA